MSLRLDWCSHEAAKYSVEHWHYSRTLPAFGLCKIGVWENDKFIGSIIYSRGANPHISNPFGLEYFSVCELTRIALNKHINSVSRMISISLKMIHREYPGIKLVVSYADTEQNHLGVIYQAANWLYLGEAISTEKWFINGRWMKRRNAWGYIQAAKQQGREIDFPMQPAFNKYKYVYPFTSEVRRNIEPMCRPYPKHIIKEQQNEFTP